MSGAEPWIAAAIMGSTLMVSDATTEKSAAALSVGVGAFSDPLDFQGMAHYLVLNLLGCQNLKGWFFAIKI